MSEAAKLVSISPTINQASYVELEIMLAEAEDRLERLEKGAQNREGYGSLAISGLAVGSGMASTVGIVRRAEDAGVATLTETSFALFLGLLVAIITGVLFNMLAGVARALGGDDQ